MQQQIWGMSSRQQPQLKCHMAIMHLCAYAFVCMYVLYAHIYIHIYVYVCVCFIVQLTFEWRSESLNNCTSTWLVCSGCALGRNASKWCSHLDCWQRDRTTTQTHHHYHLSRQPTCVLHTAGGCGCECGEVTSWGCSRQKYCIAAAVGFGCWNALPYGQFNVCKV